MGTEYRIVCKTCGIFRDIDKGMFWVGHLTGYPKTREAALEYAKNIEEPGMVFRVGLLLSFLLEHAGHECSFTDEYGMDIASPYDCKNPKYEFEGQIITEEPIDFWDTWEDQCQKKSK